ncbi:hypothetical protein [Priestia koreensis]|uniref:hypothetical protein n=1 Tax=Priestia koreensis TaxID=284581 RepID=UPI00301A2331
MNYIDFKLQDATKVCVDALHLRGFQVKETNGCIELLASSAKDDAKHATEILNKLDIPFIMQANNLIEVLITSLPLSIYNKVARFGGCPYSIPYAECQTHWRYFLNHTFGIRLNALAIEYNMAAFVKAANLAGIRVLSGCNGHKRTSPRFQITGVYYGAWFETVQQLFMSDLSLNYEWKVLYQGETKAEIQAIGTEWDMDRIHQDTMKMADCLQKNAQAIRDLKAHAFGRQDSEVKQLVNQQKDSELIQWMIERAMK